MSRATPAGWRCGPRGAVFLLSLLLWFGFDRSNPGFQFEERADWIPALNIAYRMGVDGISMPFVLLSTLLTPICILASWEAIETRVKEYMIAFLVLETFMVGTFCALDFVAFYVFFEGVLIPMFIIIGVWGGPRRVYSAFKFFLFTLLGSVLMLVAILTMYDQAGTTDIPTLMTTKFDPGVQIWLWLALFASFAVKVPMWPVHTWLPDAHVEAPTAGSVILAGVLLKMGGYGFLRFSIPMLPDASTTLAPLVFGLSIVAVIYTSLVALAQTDMKKLIAYSSVAHMGFVTAGTFALNRQGVEGAMIQMLSHGIVSGALFLCVGVVYDRLHSRDIARYGGLVNNMPRYAFAFMIFTMASVGLPGHQRLHRRVPGDGGRVPDQHLGGVLHHHRHHPRRRLHAVALSPRRVRQAGEGRRQGDARPVAARDRDLRAADPDRAVDGHLSVQLHRGHRPDHRPADLQLPGGGRTRPAGRHHRAGRGCPG